MLREAVKQTNICSTALDLEGKPAAEDGEAAGDRSALAGTVDAGGRAERGGDQT